MIWEAAVCDDEPVFCRRLATLLPDVLARLGETCTVACFPTAAALLADSRRFDLLFLDIQLPEMDGLTLARRLRESGQDGALVFLTAFPEHVFEAFEVEAVGYLCKPLDEPKLERAVERAVRRGCRETPLLVASHGQRWSIRPGLVYYAEVLDRKIALHLEREVVEYYGRLAELEQQLDRRFFRCHRSYLVNLDHLAALSGGTARLENGERVPVSRLRQKGLLEAMMRRLQGRGGGWCC